MDNMEEETPAFPNTTAAIDISQAASTLSTLAADLLRAPDETERIVATINDVVAELNKISEALIPADSPATIIADPLADRTLAVVKDPLAADNDQPESITSIEESSESTESQRSFQEDYPDNAPGFFDGLVSQAVVNVYKEFKYLCPFTLLHGAPCPLEDRCTLQRVCLDYIKRVLDGSGASQCQSKACPNPHIQLTCPNDFGGGECDMVHIPIYEQGVPYLAHMTMYQHLTDDKDGRTGTGEVQSRYALLELIKPHLQGKYTIKDIPISEVKED